MRLDAGLIETERLTAARDTSHWDLALNGLIAELHPEQRDFVLDPSRYLAVLCGRGAGKTLGGMARFIRRMLSTPGANCYYLAKFREHAERLMWLPLKETLKRMGFVDGVDVVYNETKLRCRIVKNGATLQLFGADKPGYIEALRGQSYHEVGVDEASIHPDAVIAKLILTIIGPRLLGALWLAGTPGDRLKGMFYEVSRRGATKSSLWSERDQRPEGWRGWSLHKWSLKSAVDKTADNPIAALVQLWKVQQDEIATQGLTDDNPIKRREYDGEWAADDTVNVYTYRIHHPDTGALWNQWDPPREGPLKIAKLPEGPTEWAHVIALDLGFSDPTAINVFSFAYDDPTRTIYHRLCFEQKGMHAQMIAHKLLGEDLNHEKPGGIIGAIGEWPNGMVADSAHQMAEMILAELANVYGLKIDPFTKGYRYKLGAITVVNGDLVDGRFKILKDSALEEQMLDLQWTESPRTGAPMERKDQPNHSTDCALGARSLITDLMTTGAVDDEQHDPRRDPKSDKYEPPLPDEIKGEFAHLFQDDYQALLG